MTSSSDESFNVITTDEQLDELVQHYLTKDAFAFDVETVGDHRVDPVRNDVLWISLACDDRTDVIPMGHPNGEYVRTDYPLLKVGERRKEKGLPIRPSDYSRDEKKSTKIFTEPPKQLYRAEVLSALEPLFFGNDALKIAQNEKFDVKSLAKYYRGRVMDGPFFDTMIASWLLDSRLTGQLNLAASLKREFGYEMEKGIGAEVERYTFDEVAKYSALDSMWTYRLGMRLYEKLEEDDLDRLMRLEMDVQEAISSMELTGAFIDQVALKALHLRLENEVDIARGQIWKIAGRVFNLNSNAEKQELLFTKKKDGGRGLHPKKRTASGAPSVAADALEPYRGKDELVDALLQYADLNKLMSTYVLPYLGGNVTRTTGGKEKTTYRESLLVNGKIHTDFVQHGAETGRFSCVSGDTLLMTSRGVFRFDEYLPQVGDTVATHTGGRKPVLRKIYKGVDQMFRVVLDNGSLLNCTADHRVLDSQQCWVRIGDLRVGDEVMSYVGVEEIYELGRELSVGSSGVFGRGQAHRGGSSEENRNDGSHCSSYPSTGDDSGRVSRGEGSSVFPLEDGAEEPYAGQEWFPAPQLQGSNLGRAWVPSGEGGREVRPVAPASDGPEVGLEGTASVNGRAPHRQGPSEQLVGQLGFGDEAGTPDVALADAVCLPSRIVEITPVGAMGVWDIEVAGDHSYRAHGFLNHNSRNPNLQNVPNAKTEHGHLIRELFYAPEGSILVCADYSQIEPRVMASFSQDPVLMDAYITGKDVYTAMAAPYGRDRSMGKLIYLAMSYGVGPDKIAATLGISTEEAKEMLKSFEKQFHKVYSYKDKVVRQARARRPVPYVETILGRRRFLPDLRETGDYFLKSRAERQAFNTLIQGSAADIMKCAIVRAHKMLPKEAKLILTVHDELLTICPEEMGDEVAEVIREAMEGIHVLDIPLIAEVKVAPNWAEGK